MIIVEVFRNGLEMLVVSALIAYGLRHLPLFKTTDFTRTTVGVALVLDWVATHGTTITPLLVLGLAGAAVLKCWNSNQRLRLFRPRSQQLRAGRRTHSAQPRTQRTRRTP